MTAPVLYANTDLVVTNWLLGCPGITSGMVGTTLPKDDSSWTALGFVRVATIGGNPNVYTKARGPVVRADCWAVSPNSDKPPWGKANNLSETVLAACYAADGRNVVLPAGYPPARILSAWVVTEPRRVDADAGDYARYSMDLGFSWVQL